MTATVTGKSRDYMALFNQVLTSYASVDVDIIKNCIASKLNLSDFNTWISGLIFSTAENSDCLTIYAKSNFCKDYVIKNFKELIVSATQENYPFISEISFTVGLPSQSPAQIVNDNSIALFAVNDETATENPLRFVNENEINHRGLISSYSFINFATEKCNELAAVACRQISDVNVSTFRQIYVHGASGSGKTHLLQAIGNQIIAFKPDAKVLYMTAEKFMYSFIKHSKEKTLIEFKDDLRSAYCLIIDDIDFLASKEGTESELFHTICELRQMDKRIVLAGSASPFLIEGLSKNLATEIASNLVVEISPSTSDLRKKIIKSKTYSAGVSLSDEVIEFLSLKQLNGKQIDGAIKRVFMYSSLSNAEMTVARINNLLGDLFYNPEITRAYNISDIKKCVCDFYSVSVQKIDSYAKEKSISLPRQIAMYLSKQLTGKTFADIGKMFGGKDHATVLYAVKKIENMMNGNIEFSKQIETIENNLSQS